MTKYDGKEYFISQTDVENGSQQSDQNNTNMNHQSTTTQTVANAHQQQEQSSQATVLSETGQQTSNSGVMLSSILGVIGSAVLLISRKFKQQFSIQNMIEEREDTLIVEVNCTDLDAFYISYQLAPLARMLGPQQLIDQFVNRLEVIKKQYTN